MIRFNPLFTLPKSFILAAAPQTCPEIEEKRERDAHVHKTITKDSWQLGTIHKFNCILGTTTTTRDMGIFHCFWQIFNEHKVRAKQSTEIAYYYVFVCTRKRDGQRRRESVNEKRHVALLTLFLPCYDAVEANCVRNGSKNANQVDNIKMIALLMHRMKAQYIFNNDNVYFSVCHIYMIWCLCIQFQ